MSIPSYPALTKRELAMALGGLLLVFLFVNGPVWMGPWDATPSIVLSYLPIPFVVAGLLARRRRLKWLPWLLHTVELTFAKFMVTAIFLVVLWMVRGGPPPPTQGTGSHAPAPARSARTPPQLPPPTAFAPDELTTLYGRVVNASGTPVVGALVMVSSGLDEANFAPRKDAVSLALGPAGYTPSHTAVQVGQPLVVHSEGQVLHTAQVVGAEGGVVFNLPVLAKGDGARHVFYKPHGELRVRCTVHGKRELEATLFVVHHPFFTVTGDDGAFLIRNVPTQARELRTVGDEGSAVAERPDDESALTLMLTSTKAR